MWRKLSFILLITLTMSTSLLAQSFASEIIRKSNLSFEDAISIHSGSIWNYSKANNAFETRFATELFTLPKFQTTMGLSTTYTYCWNLFTREEIQDFWSQIVTQAIWIDIALPNNFQLLIDTGAGICVSKLQAISIEQKDINNYFNSLAISVKAIAYRPLINIGETTICWNAGTQIRILVEQENCYQNIGLIAGITIKAAKK